MKTHFAALTEEINKFVTDRDWEKFHTPKNLSMALSVEASELMEHFLWENDASDSLDDNKRDKISQELADVFIYLIRLSEVLEVDILKSVENKLAINREKYPVDMVKGSSKKYTEY